MAKPRWRVLIIDDARADRELYRRRLQRDPHADYDLHEAESGEQGLALCATVKLDCVLLDYRLPDCNGIQFLERLHAQTTGPRPAVVILTASGSERVAVEALQHGADDYLVKGATTPEQLWRTVQNAIEKTTLRHNYEVQQRELREREALFQRLFTEAAVPTIMQTPEGRFLHVNRAACAFFARSAAELCQWTFREVTLPADLAETEARVQRLVRGEWNHYQHEKRFVRPSGEVRWALVSNTLLRDADGAPHMLVAQLQDITARKAAEAAHAQQLRLTQAITDNATTALFIMDERQHCVFMNPAAEQLTGYTLADVHGRALHDVVHHTHPDGTPYPLADCPIDRAFPERNQMQGEEVFVHKNGSFYPVAFTASPLREGTAITGTVIEVQDLTARKAAEDAQRRLAAIVTSSEDAILSKTLDGIVTSWNAGAERLFGYRAEEMLGQSIRRLIPAERQAEEDEILARLRRGETLQHVETVRRTKDGRLVEVSITTSPMRDAQGVIIGAAKIARDITDRKRAADALAQHARDLAHAHADLRQVAYVSAHDLQEPVRQLGIYSQYLAKRYGDDLDADTQQAIAYIVEGTARMQAQFTDLMHYLEMEDPGVGITTTNCETILQYALEQLREAITTSGATITHDPLPTLEANAKHLQLVFQELLENAVKFHNSTPPQVHVWAEREADAWRFAVRDNGIGMSQSGMRQLFGFFRKLQQRQDYPGTGMGLAICKKIVERHGGRIWLESTPGQGSVCYFTIADTRRQSSAWQETMTEEG